jgi:hypothetical protein
MHIHVEGSSEYRCHECRGTCTVFLLTRESELRLCGSCFEKLREAMHAVMIPGTEQLSAPIARIAVQPSGAEGPTPRTRNVNH